MYSISGTAFVDANGNAIDDGELGVGLVSITLRDASGAVVGVSNSDTLGRFAFTGLASGVYSVSAAPPSGVVSERTTPLVVSITDRSVANQDFGFYKPATVAGFAFPDQNGDGAINGSDAPLDGVTVKLVDAAGHVVATTVSAGNGYFAHGVYQFDNVRPGGYTVQAVGPASSGQAGSVSVDLASGQFLGGQSVGLTKAATVAGFIFPDQNRNGALDAAEAPVDGVTVNLVDATGHVVASTVSAGNGFFAHGVYQFDNVRAGAYTVQTVASGAFASSSLQVQLAPGQVLYGQSVGVAQPASISGFLFGDANVNGVFESGETLLDGVTVNLVDVTGRVVASKVSAGNGFLPHGVYQFDNVSAGTYTLRTVSPDGLQSSALQVQVAPGQTLTAQGIGLSKPASVAGLVFPDSNGSGALDGGEAPVDGVTVNLVDATGHVVATTRSAANPSFPHGVYEFDNVTAGAYTVQAVGSGQAGALPVQLTPGQFLAGQNVGLAKTASVAGFIFNDANANGAFEGGETALDGVTVNLVDAAGHIVASTVSAGNGFFAHGVYQFDNVKAGAYTVQTVASGGFPTPSSLAIQPAAGQSLFGQNVGLVASTGVSGSVYADADHNGRHDAGEAGLSGVGVMLIKDAGTPNAVVTATTTTDAGGRYAFASVAPGAYAVASATPSGQLGTTPASVTVTKSASGGAVAEFGFAADPTPKADPLPAAASVNIILRGQSNANYFAGMDGSPNYLAQLKAKIQTDLGFDGVTQKVNLLADSATLHPSTGVVGNWLSPIGGDYHNGWTANSQEIGLLSDVAQQSAAFKAAPTLVLWLHNESDSEIPGLTTNQWMSAVRYEAGLLRAALGQDAGETPYLFVDAIPFIPSNVYGLPGFTNEGQDWAEQNIRIGMSALAADPVFNAKVVAQLSDVNMEHDGAIGGAHLGPADNLALVDRLARSISDTLSASALPGSPVAAAGRHLGSAGPQVASAASVAGHPDQLLLTVQQDKATGFATLDPDAAAGLGWSIRHQASGSDSALLASGKAVQIVDATHLLVTFDKAVPTDAKLFYAWGGDRLAASDTLPGAGNAVYDSFNLPIWTDPNGVSLGAGSSTATKALATASASSLASTDSLASSGGVAHAPSDETFSFTFTHAKVAYQHDRAFVTGPDNVAHDVTGIGHLHFADGVVDVADSQPLVDDLFYYAQNRDVWAAHIDGRNVDADQHYAVYGWKEGRDPNAYFSTTGYLATNPDVKAAALNPLDHYDQYGWREGRDPGPNFSTKAYLAAHPDVAAAHIDPLAHFLAYGMAEGLHT